MLGPYLPNTELLFPLPMGAAKFFAYKFLEPLYQYLIGCYFVTSRSPFFTRMQRTEHSSEHTRVFILPIHEKTYTCIELTPSHRCAFGTTPFFCIVFRDSDAAPFTGQLDPTNGATLKVEAQGPIESSRLSWEDMQTIFDQLTCVSTTKMAESLVSQIDGHYIPRGGSILVKESVPLAGQDGTAGSMDIVRFLQSLVPVNSQEETPEDPFLQKLRSLQESLHTSSYGSNPLDSEDDTDSEGRTPLTFPHLKRSLREAAMALKGDKLTLHNLILVTYSLLLKDGVEIPPLSEMNPEVLCNDLLVEMIGMSHVETSNLKGNLQIVSLLREAFEDSPALDGGSFLRKLLKEVVAYDSEKVEGEWSKISRAYADSGKVDPLLREVESMMGDSSLLSSRHV